MSNAALLDPNATPSALNFGVKRLNYIPLVIALSVVLLFGLIVAFVAMQKAEQQAEQNNQVAPISSNAPTESASNPVANILEDAGIIRPESATQYAPTTIEEAQAQTTAAQPDYQTAAPAPLPQDAELPTYTANPPYNPNANYPPPQQQDYSGYQEPAYDNSPNAEVLRQIQQERNQRLLQAINAKTAVAFNSPSTQSGASYSAFTTNNSDPLSQLQDVKNKLQNATALLSGSDSPMAQYQQQLQSLQQMAGMGGGAAPQLPAGLQPMQGGSNGQGYDQFNGDESRWSLNTKMKAPKPFTVLAGDVIPGIFITGINSDLPGQITGQVSQNVYDSATGRNLLIPQGTEAVGEYASEVIYGQERLLFGWKRLTFPDGKTLDLGSMQGADSAGYAGVKDLVNHHFWRIFGSATMMSFVTAGVEISQDDTASMEGSRKAGDALSEALGQQLGQAAAQMLMKNLNIAPTIEIRPGNRFNIIVTKDLVFDKPYSNFDY